MAGRMGNDRVKVQNLQVLKIEQENNFFVVSGCVPGSKNGYVIIEKCFYLKEPFGLYLFLLYQKQAIQYYNFP